MSVNTGGAEQKMIEQLHSRLDWTIEDNAKKAIQIADLQARVTELEHKEIHYLQMLEDEGIDSSSAKQSECIYEARVKELEDGGASFYEFVNLATNWLKKYPPDIFDGSSGDSGPLFVVAIRAAINALPPEPPE